MAIFKVLVITACLALATVAKQKRYKIKHVGCYEDSLSNRLLGAYYQIVPHIMTPAVCVQLCKRLNYHYAGVQNGQECFCGDEDVTRHKKVSGCDMRCPGDETKTCGGYLRIDVFKGASHSSVSIYDKNNRYQGCYKDYENRILSKSFIDYPNILTPERCIQACNKQGYKLAGLEHSTQCFCDNELRRKEMVDSSECNMRCPGSAGSICGGFWRISVYKV